MRVDVITLHAVQNYGSVLQALATQKLLEKHGCEVKIINYIKKVSLLYLITVEIFFSSS